MVKAAYIVGWAIQGALKQVSYGVLQHSAALQSDGVEISFRFKRLVKLGNGKSRIGPKEVHQITALVASDDGSQNLFPAISAVDIALAQCAALKIAELIEDKKRVVALATKVVIPCCAFLIAIGGADRTVHIQGDPLGRLCIVHALNPLTRQIGQGSAVVGRSQNACLKPSHLAG